MSSRTSCALDVGIDTFPLSQVTMTSGQEAMKDRETAKAALEDVYKQDEVKTNEPGHEASGNRSFCVSSSELVCSSDNDESAASRSPHASSHASSEYLPVLIDADEATGDGDSAVGDGTTVRIPLSR